MLDKIDTKKKRQILILSIIIGGLLFTSSTLFSTSSLSGYQSITAEFYQVYWPNAQGTGKTLVKPLSGSVMSWDQDNIYADSGGLIIDGSSDLQSISASVENPKFNRSINYNEWWINDTVTASNPTGEAKHFEWSIDVYTMNINFYASGKEISTSIPEIWVELQNNVDSVFTNFGAEEAASYVIYAQTEKYNYAPADAGWHIIQPTVGNFELMFLDGSTISPSAPPEGSDLDFDKLTPYSHIAIKFELYQFGQANFGSAPTVQMIVELNILTVGRFDYVLTYVEGGDDDIAPVGQLGLWASMGAGLEQGLSGLGDMLGDVLPSINVELIVLIVVGCIMTYFLLRFLILNKMKEKLSNK